MTTPLPLRLAVRELRSGLRGFRIFLACLLLGVAAIAIVGSLSASIERGMAQQSRPLLGGDAEISVIHRRLSEQERTFLDARGDVSTVATLRAMASAGDAGTLVELKAVDQAYPLYGTLTFADDGALAEALSRKDGRHGAVVEPALLVRLGVAPGDTLQVGEARFELRGVIDREPDRVADGFILGPRVMVSLAALEETGLVQPGSLVRWHYRLRLGDDQDAGQVAEAAEAAFPDAGWRIRTSENAAPGVERFLDRLTFFMTLVGLTALIVGGVGIANAVRSFLERRRRNIATLKCLGASSGLVFRTYLVEVLLIATLGIAAGLLLGALAPVLAKGAFAEILPIPIAPGFEWLPLARAAGFGYLVTLAFALWPLARAGDIKPAALFRDMLEPSRRWPRRGYVAACLVAFLAIAALAFASFDNREAIIWYGCGLIGSFALLSGLAWAIMQIARRYLRPGGAVARYAVGNLHRPGAPTPAVVLSLGLGLTLFVTLALIDISISRELRASLPEQAPSFFFLDVPSGERQGFVRMLESTSGVENVETAPMLRGRVVSIAGVPADEVEATPDSEWALRGDRGLTYAERLPSGSRLSAGEWWPQNYDGPPLVSFSKDIARGIGLELGDEVTVNVLGREVTAEVANLREVDWRTLQINFVMVFSPNTLAGAPHMNIVTVAMDEAQEPALLRTVAQEFPTVTAVRVKDALDAVSDLVSRLLAAVRGASAVTFAVGLLVLAGALSTGLSARIYDAVVLKTYGATRRQLIGAFALEYALLGLMTAAFAVAAGTASAWAIVRFVMEMPWSFSLPTALLTAFVAMAVTVTAGLWTTRAALGARPARQLRTE